jgi:ribosomal protein S18 acetylase RimI-like enzyme
MDVRPFTESDLDEAGALLAWRHALHRRREPLLDKRFEAPDAATAEIAGVFGTPDASGAVARSGGRMVGYLLGEPRLGGAWGPGLWIGSAGYAAGESETIRELYAVAAQRWVDEGRTAHYVVVPAGGPDVDAWFRLGFGHQQVHGLRGSEPFSAKGIRAPTEDDLSALAALDIALPEHQARAPVFSARTPPTVEDSIGEWRETFADPAWATFVAERDGAVVGAAVGGPATGSGHHSGPARPDGAAYLVWAAVLPEARGLGLGGALGRAVVGWAAETGYRTVVTDWRSTNLLSSRAWPAIGFRPSFYRLHRLIGY